METTLHLYPSKSGRPQLLVLFIHGLDGHYEKTWSSTEGQFWPLWLTELDPIIQVASLQYQANSSLWLSKINSDMSIVDRSKDVIDELSLHLGDLAMPTIAVCHSMGGLLLKQILRSINHKNHRLNGFCNQIKHIMFLGTPHSGSKLADIVHFFSIVSKSTKYIKDMEYSSSWLDDLNSWFKNFVQEKPGANAEFISIYRENIETNKFLVVDKDSSDIGIGGVEVVPLDKNHIELCKLGSKKNRVFRKIEDVFLHIKKEVSEIDETDKNCAPDWYDNRIIYSPNESSILTRLNDEIYLAASNMFSCLSRTISSSKIPANKLSVDNYLHEMANFVDSSKLICPLLISGFVGCGKSWLLRLLYGLMRDKWNDDSSLVFPIFIDIRELEKEGEQSLHEMIDGVKSSVLERRINDVVLIVDSIDPSRDRSRELTRRVFEYFDQKFKNHKRVVGVGRWGRGLDYEDLPFHPEIGIMLEPVSCDDQDKLEEFVECYLNCIECFGKEKPSNKYILKILERLQINSLDPFTIDLIIERSGRFFDKESLDFSSLIESHICELLNIGNNDLPEISKKVFDALNNECDAGVVDGKLLSLIRSHTKIRDYLIAYYVTHFISETDASDGLLEKVFTYDINQFAKQLLRRNEMLQSKFVDFIEERHSSLPPSQLTHIVYLLGRTTFPKCVERSVEILQKLQEKHSGDNINNDDSLALLLARSIDISLIYHGDKDSLDGYINRIIDNKKWNNLNRGFHLEYYGDLEYDFRKQNLVAKDQIEYDFPLTYSRLKRRLIQSLEKRKKDVLYDLDLMTLCTLALSRMAEAKLNESEGRNIEILRIVEMSLNTFTFDNQKLVRFLDQAMRFLPLGNSYTPLTAILDLYSLKTHMRAGWKGKMRQGYEEYVGLESVADHSYFCVILGMFLLPENEDIDFEVNECRYAKKKFREYDKNRILEMLALHDIGEWKHGDIPTPEKTQSAVDDEMEEVFKLSVLRVIPCLHVNKDFFIKFCDFTSGDKFNARIAKDIDIFESMIQLAFYKNRFEIESDWRTFYDSQSKLIHTRICRKWLAYLEREIKFGFFASSIN